MKNVETALQKSIAINSINPNFRLNSRVIFVTDIFTLTFTPLQRTNYAPV